MRCIPGERVVGRKSPIQLLEQGLGLDGLWVVRAGKCWKSLPRGHNLQGSGEGDDWPKADTALTCRAAWTVLMQLLMPVWATGHFGHLERYRGAPTHACKEQRAFVVALSLFFLP